MSWKKTNPKHEKIKFLGDWLKKKQSFTDLCEQYGISRKTGYKFIHRYENEGDAALEERPHARHHHPNGINESVQKRIIELKTRYPKWGPEKLRLWLRLNEPEITWPATSTMGDILKKNGLVKKRRYRKHVQPYTEPFALCDSPNAVWSADFKGQFRLGKNGPYCYPLTISDNYSRFLLCCEGFTGPTLKSTKKTFFKIFYEYGLPYSIKTDNGQPFAGLGIGGLTRLSIWWLKLGILPERIALGCPEQNGRHERMHRTLKEATAAPAKENFKAQQKCFDDFKNEYNYERPHQSLDGKRPADVYSTSMRALPNKTPEIIYPDHFLIRKVRTNGEIKWCGKTDYVSGLLTKEPIGLEMVETGKAIVYFSKLKLGTIDVKENKIIRS